MLPTVLSIQEQCRVSFTAITAVILGLLGHWLSNFMEPQTPFVLGIEQPVITILGEKQKV